jgi:hypothetical protein
MLARVTSKVRWLPRGLGLGTPLNSALAEAGTGHLFWRSLWLYLLAGLATAITMMGLDLRTARSPRLAPGNRRGREQRFAGRSRRSRQGHPRGR